MEQVTITEKEFNSLPEYSCTIPTGTTIGKRWRRGWPYHKPTEWYIGEYVENNDPDKVGILWKRVVAVVRLKKNGSGGRER